jgi:iron complex outermembrane receptor protein
MARRRGPLSLLPLLVAFALVRSASARAEDAPPSAALSEPPVAPETIVSTTPAPAAPPPASASTPPLEVEPEVELEAVVRGVRLPQAAAATAPGAAVTVIEADRFAGEAKGAGALLATSPGVAVTEQGGLGQLSTVSIRGASADQVKVLLDGVPLNPAAGGGVDLSSIPPQWISRIEVVRGTEGVRHGTGALGGVVNVVTAPPRAGSWSASLTGGSFGTQQADAQGAVGGEGWGLLGSVAGSRSDGDFTYVTEDSLGRRAADTRAHDASALGGALVKGFALVGGGRLDAAAQVSGGNRDLPGVPGNLTPNDWQEDARGIGSVRYRRGMAGGLSVSAAGSARVDWLSLSLQDVQNGTPIRQRGVAGTGSVGADWCGDHGTLSASVEAGGERLAGDGIGDHVRPTYALVLAGEVTSLGGRARLGPAVRLERAGDEQGVSAKLGGALPLVGPLSVRASAGRTYRVPSFSELYLQQGLVLPNPALRPEVGLGGDGGLVADGAFGTASLGAFATVYQDLIVYQTVPFRRLMPMNVDRSLVRGLEAEVATAPWRGAAGLGAQAAYTYTQSEVLLGKEDVLALDLPRRPRHRLYARVSAGGPAADAHVESQWISRQWLGFGQTAPIPAALTFGAGASVRLSRAAGLRLHVEVRNLLDVRTLTDGFDNPLPGRTVLVTIRAGSTRE